MIETRTFTEIWKSLTAQEREDLQYSLMVAKVAKTRQAIFYWGTGQRTPGNVLVREKIALVISRKTGKKCTANTLFPAA